jgi:hypothetical protein
VLIQELEGWRVGWVTGLFSRMLTWHRKLHVLNSHEIDGKSAPRRLVFDSRPYKAKESFSHDQSIGIFHRKIDSSTPSGNPSDASDKIKRSPTAGTERRTDVEKRGHNKTSALA